MTAEHVVPNSTIRIGCSGWQYAHWRGSFYPAELPSRLWFEHYAQHFDTVEINNTFYRLPEASAFAAWKSRAPARFVFAVKASRYLTHMKKLKEPAEPLGRFFSRARQLGSALGPVLYQLPPRWTVDLERLRAFLQLLPPRVRHAVEFREPSWYSSAVLDALNEHRVALCLHDMEGSATGMERTGPFVYVRFHGTARYGGRYPDDRLERWAAWLVEQARSGCAAYVYFNNDVGGHAPRDAARLREMVARAGWT